MQKEILQNQHSAWGAVVVGCPQSGLSNMAQQSSERRREPVRDLGRFAPGLLMPIVLVALLPITFWSIRDSGSSKSGRAIFALSVSVMLWICTSIFQVCRGCRKLGWNRSTFTKFLSNARPDDPDQLFVWQWVLQACYSTGAFVICMIALTLTS
jgi:hypothetical protein